MDGVVLFDKPRGITSHDVVAQVRRRFGRSVKVGHAGTLDPFATGLLLVLLGRGTRTQQFLMPLRKTYRVRARFGTVSTTGDPDGEIAVTGKVPPRPFTLPTGGIEQRPPAYSAIKIGGERAYKKARRGEEVEIPARPVTIHRFELLQDDGEEAEFEVECSAGTYIRTLIADLGDAYCLELRRTAIGPFSVDDADGETVIPLNDALSFIPEQFFPPEEGKRLTFGQSIELAAEGQLRLTDQDGLIAIGEADGSKVKPVVGFRP